jgi:hypothetical protein
MRTCGSAATAGKGAKAALEERAQDSLQAQSAWISLFNIRIAKSLMPVDDEAEVAEPIRRYTGKVILARKKIKD